MRGKVEVLGPTKRGRWGHRLRVTMRRRNKEGGKVKNDVKRDRKVKGRTDRSSPNLHSCHDTPLNSPNNQQGAREGERERERERERDRERAREREIWEESAAHCVGRE